MPTYEYAVVPAPKQVPKVKGVKGADQRFARGLTDLLNTWGAEGWEFQRAETLPCEERSGLIGRTTGTQVVLVFRREVEDEVPESYPETAATPEELARELPARAPAGEPSAGPRLTATRDFPERLRPMQGADTRNRRG